MTLRMNENMDVKGATHYVRGLNVKIEELSGTTADPDFLTSEEPTSSPDASGDSDDQDEDPEDDEGTEDTEDGDSVDE